VVAVSKRLDDENDEVRYWAERALQELGGFH
jgi:hypothetical protein